MRRDKKDYLDPLNNIKNPVNSLPDLSFSNPNSYKEIRGEESEISNPEDELPDPEEAGKKNPQVIQSFTKARIWAKMGVLMAGTGLVMLILSDYPKEYSITLIAIGLTFIWKSIEEYKEFRD